MNNRPLKYKGVFRKKLGKHKNIKEKLHVDPTITPVAQPPRKIPYGYQHMSSEHLKKLKDDDIIENAPMNEPTTWMSNLVFAPKLRDPQSWTKLLRKFRKNTINGLQ